MTVLKRYFFVIFLFLPAILLLSCTQDSSLSPAEESASTPDKPTEEQEYNVFGKVTCEGRPLAGVWLCDGVQWAKTDAGGNYFLLSDKTAGYVYLQTPSGCEPECEACWPGFWKKVSDASVKEELNFELHKVQDNRHTVLMSADWHMRSVNRSPRDYEQAVEYFDEVSEFKSGRSVPVFSIALGDETWDSFWARTGFDLPRFRSWAADFPVPLYTVIGNHDHDMTAKDDYSAAAVYRSVMGPTEFSFDRGEVHYIIMDNVTYVPSDRSVIESFTRQQLNWLSTDLSHLSSSTPVIFCVHVPMHGWSWSGSVWTPKERGENYPQVLQMLKRFDNVHIFSGHSHLHEEFNCKASGLSTGNMYEHKIVALGGDLWMSATTIGYNISRDGLPGGYEIVEVDGKNINWTFKPMGKSPELQFRAYSLSEIKKYWSSDKTVSAFVASNPDFSFDSLYKDLPSGAVLVNVFESDPLFNCCKLQISDEKGNLTPRLCRIKDPKSLTAIEAWWWKTEGKLIGSSYQTAYTQHIYYVEPTGSELSVTLSDRNGKVVSARQYKLPIEFNCDED